MESTDYIGRYQQIVSIEQSKNNLIEVALLLWSQLSAFLIAALCLGSSATRDGPRRHLFTRETGP